MMLDAQREHVRAVRAGGSTQSAAAGASQDIIAHHDTSRNIDPYKIGKADPRHTNHAAVANVVCSVRDPDAVDAATPPWTPVDSVRG